MNAWFAGADRDRRRSWSESVEWKDRSAIVRIVSIVVIVAMFVPTLVHPPGDLLRPIFWALSAQQVMMAFAFWLNARGRTDIAVILIVFGLLAMTAFITIVSEDGFHDVVLLVLPAVLVVAGILLNQRIFAVFTACTVVLYGVLAYMELSGFLASNMSAHTTVHDLIDGSVILLVTAFAVGLLTNSLQRTISGLRTSEEELAKSNDEQHRQSRLLRESEARYRLVVESALDPIVSTDIHGQFLFANSSAARLAECAIEDLLGMNFFDFCLPENRESIRRQFIHQVFDRGTNSSYEFALRSRTGTVKWLSANVSLDTKEGRPAGFHVVARDITDRRRAEDEVRRLNQDLEARVRERTAELEAAMTELQSISYSVSHDLRAPLRHIGAYVELTQSHQAIRDNAAAHRNLQTIAFSAKWMGMLVDGLIDYLSIGQTEMHLSGVDLSELIRSIIRDQEPETTGRFIRWKVATLPIVNGDRRLLRQAFANVLSNAVKFTQSRQETVVEIGVSTESSGSEYIIYVRDNGIGFDPQYQERLFGLFQRLHSRAEHAGTGIGLANVRRIVHRHGGRVWADGAVDRGATFYISLPVFAGLFVEEDLEVTKDSDAS